VTARFERGRAGFSSIETDRPPRRVELDDPVALGIRGHVAEDRGAAPPITRGAELFRQAVPVEDVVAEDEADLVGADEGAPDHEGVGEPARVRLNRIGETKPELGAVAEELLEKLLIVRRGDDQDVRDAGQHQRGQRIVDHRLVVDGQKLLRDHERDRMQARAGSARQDDALHRSASAPRLAFGLALIRG
jgi:hypothetical protein